jgi:cobalt/nickel transport system permease protein
MSLAAPASHHHDHARSDRFGQGDARPPIERIDPRLRVVVATAFSLVVAVGDRFPALALAAAIAAAGAALSGISLRAVRHRLVPLNVVMLALAVVLPLTAAGERLASLGPLGLSEQGLRTAAVIALKANAIVLALAALLGTLELPTLGHALWHLHIPEKLIHLLMFTVRYLDVLDREYDRLRGAMRVRSFRPGLNAHTLRSYGHLVGMLLVRSLDRAERIVAAMKCRGFQGRFYLLDHFSASRRDLWFAAACAAVLIALAVLEWV